MEPVNVELPEPGYLEGVRELAHQHGALLVFDEMVTGFRLANGGAQELFGVTPDLACFGKALANGMPLSALVGKREYMELLPRVGLRHDVPGRDAVARGRPRRARGAPRASR